MGLDKLFAVDPEFQFIEIVLQLITFCLDQIPLVQLEDLHFVLFLLLILLPLLDAVVVFCDVGRYHLLQVIAIISNDQSIPVNMVHIFYCLRTRIDYLLSLSFLPFICDLIKFFEESVLEVLILQQIGDLTLDPALQLCLRVDRVRGGVKLIVEALQPLLISVLLTEGGLHGSDAAVLRFEFEVDAILHELPIVLCFHIDDVRVFDHSFAIAVFWVFVVAGVNDFKTFGVLVFILELESKRTEETIDIDVEILICSFNKVNLV